MRRFYIENKHIINDTVVVKGEEARHIGRVLRLKSNDNILLFDREGNTYTGIIIDRKHEEVKVKVIDKKKRRLTNKTNVILCQAITKAKKMDFIVQKSTELGVCRIIPFFSSRCVPKWDSIKASNRVQHWQKIVTASVKQSGVREIPAVENILDFSDLIKKDFEGFLKLILWERESELSLKKIFTSKGIPSKILFVVGPEGGFSEDEIILAKEDGFVPVGLGNYILRAETVPIAVLTIISYENGELG